MKKFLQVLLFATSFIVPAAAQVSKISQFPVTNSASAGDNFLIDSTNSGAGTFKTGRISVSAYDGSVHALTNSGNTLAGTFNGTGNAGGLTNVNATNLTGAVGFLNGGLSAGLTNLLGGAVYTNGTGAFSGFGTCGVTLTANTPYILYVGSESFGLRSGDANVQYPAAYSLGSWVASPFTVPTNGHYFFMAAGTGPVTSQLYVSNVVTYPAGLNFIGGTTGPNLTGVLTNQYGPAYQTAAMMPVPIWYIDSYADCPNSGSPPNMGSTVTGQWLTNAITMYGTNGMLATYGPFGIGIDLDDGCFTNRDGSGNLQLSGSFTNAAGARLNLTNLVAWVHSSNFLFQVHLASVATNAANTNWPSSWGRPQTSNDCWYLHSCGVDSIKIDETGGTPQSQQISAQNWVEALAYSPMSTIRTVNPKDLNINYGSFAFFTQTNLMGVSPTYIPALYAQAFNDLEDSSTGDPASSGSAMLANITNLYRPYLIGPGHFLDIMPIYSGTVTTNRTANVLSMAAECVSPQCSNGTNVNAANLSFMTNALWKSVWQDAACNPGYLVTNVGLVQVWSRKLSTGQLAVAFVNFDETTGTPSTNATVNFSTLGLFGYADFTNVWAGATVGISNGTFTATVKATNCQFYIATPAGQAADFFPTVNNGYHLGTSSQAWQDVWAGNGNFSGGINSSRESGVAPHTVSVTASPFTYTGPNAFNTTVWIDIPSTTCSIALNGGTIYTGIVGTSTHVPITLTLQSGDTLTLTYTGSAPTMKQKGW